MPSVFGGIRLASKEDEGMSSSTQRFLAAIDKEIDQIEKDMGRKESLAETYGLVPFAVTFFFGLGVLCLHRFLS